MVENINWRSIIGISWVMRRVVSSFQTVSTSTLVKTAVGLASLGTIYLSRETIKRYLMCQLCALSYGIEKCATQHKRKFRPTKIIIVRHGQSRANVDDQVYAQLPDNQIPLTDLGKEQADEIGRKLAEYIGLDKYVVFFVSPFLRAQETAKEILKSFPLTSKVISEPRIREQEWGNLQKFQKHPEKCRQIYEERNLVGRFYYRFETGESASDVYDRVTMFLETLFREMDSFSCVQAGCGKERVFVLVTHGMVMRLLMMRYFKKSIEEFDAMNNPKNCEAWVLQKNEQGAYCFHDKVVLDKQT